MIPESEWKFFEGTEQRIKHLYRHQLENQRAVITGAPLAWDPMELAERQMTILQELDYPTRVEQALGMSPSPEESRHLELHRRWALRALFETHPDIIPLVTEIQSEVAAFKPQVGGRTVSRSVLRDILANEPDRSLREQAWNALTPLGEAIQERATELIRRRELLARSVVEDGFPSIAFHGYEQDRAEVLGFLDEFERLTRTEYQSIRKEVAGVLGIHDVEPWDIEHGITRMGLLPPSHFPAEEAGRAVVEQAEAWGFSTRPVHVEEQELPVRAIIQTLGIPDEIRILWNPQDGLAGFASLFNAYGQAIHGSRIQTRRHFLEQESPAMLEATGHVFRASLGDPAWIESRGGKPGEAIESHRRADRLMRIVELRRRAALLAFENLVYTQSEVEPQRLFNDVMEHMLQDTRRPTILWPALYPMVASPLADCSGILGAQIGAQLLERLKQEFPEPWKEKAVGGWLTENVFAAGAKSPWNEKIETVTGSPPSILPLIRELEVSPVVPTLEEHEETSDAEAEEYFKGIDLSDLD